MTKSVIAPVASNFASEVGTRLERLASLAADGGLDAPIGLMTRAIETGAVIQAFGTGHSEAFAMEIAGRAGGLIPTNKIALRDVVLRWCDAGVTVFRVDNPHTKPVPFWEWLIAEVRKRHPETVFLSEAFTRPAMMTLLAKAGFSQSYTYFTWKNTKSELRMAMRRLPCQEALPWAPSRPSRARSSPSC